MFYNENMQSNNSETNIFTDAKLNWYQFLIPTVLVIGLVVLSFYHYLAFHVLAEFFTVGIAITMFVVIWHTYDFSQNHFLMYLAVGYLWLGGLDVIHTLLYYGMPTALDQGNLTSQFWIGARFLESLLLLTSPYFIAMTFARNRVVLLFGIISVILTLSIFIGYFPDTFVDGVGLTTFKVVSEYIIIALLLAAIFHITKHRRQIEPTIYRLMMISIVLTIGAELAFTFYVSMYGLSNLAGHIFKIYSFWIIYIAIVRTSLVNPFMILNRDLQELQDRNLEAQKLAKLGHWSLDLISNKLVWSDEIFRIYEIDPKEFNASYEAFISSIHPEDREKVDTAYKDSLAQKSPYKIEHRLLLNDGRIKYVLEQGHFVFDENGEPIGSIGTVLDITDRKMIENRLLEKQNELLLAKQESENANKYLEKLNAALSEREGRIIEIKQEVNKLSKELGRDFPYKETEKFRADDNDR